MDINQYAQKIYQQNKDVGWWDDPDRCIYQTMQLISTEIAEATEGERKNLMDDHLPHRKMGEVELADALIRVLDLGGHFEWNFTTSVHHRWLNEKSSIGKMHLALNIALANLANAFDENIHKDKYSSPNLSMFYSYLIDSIIQVALILDYDIFAAMDEKIAYNLNRADHKRENRAEENGKKF